LAKILFKPGSDLHHNKCNIWIRLMLAMFAIF
jgi:hypothetical protein